MKYQIIIAALLSACVDARHHKHHRQHHAHGLNQVRSSGRDEHETATVWNKDKPHPGYPASQDGFEGSEGLGKYNREVPDNF